MRISKTDQQAAGMVKAINRRRHLDTCAPCAWIRWRQVLDARDHVGNAEVLRVLRVDRDRSDEHVCQTGPADSPIAQPTSSTDYSEAGSLCSDSDADVPAARLPVDRAVFRAMAGGGWISHRRFHRERVRGTLRAEAGKAGLDPDLVTRLGGHSLRAGFVTDVFAAGAQPDEIMRQTGHRNTATVEIYRRDRPLIGNAVLHLPDER